MELQLIITSFIAGTLTILAPCIFPLLPILLGTAADNGTKRNRAFTVIASLLASITILTLLIFGTSNALGISTGLLRVVSAIIIVFVGVFMVAPQLWELISAKLKLNNSSNKLLGKALQKDSKAGDILVGAALGPVFSSCSPTYAIIVASILPQDFATGTLYLLWYIFGLGLMFVLLAILGRKFITKLSWATNPKGWFKRSIGILFLIIGLSIFFNFDKQFEALLLEFDFYSKLIEFEFNLQK